MKTAIVYYSKHHENTKKIIDSIAQNNEVTLIDATVTQNWDLSGYDLIGFASGIYYSKFHKSVLKFAENNLPVNKNVFFIYTYGSKSTKYTKAIEEIALKKHTNVVGAFGCPGLDTFGPFKLIGGIAKGRPNNDDLKNANSFYKKLVKA